MLKCDALHACAPAPGLLRSSGQLCLSAPPLPHAQPAHRNVSSPHYSCSSRFACPANPRRSLRTCVAHRARRAAPLPAAHSSQPRRAPTTVTLLAHVQTYDNDCSAKCAGVDFTEGKCPEVDDCCGEGHFCCDGACLPDGTATYAPCGDATCCAPEPCTCPEVVDTVCGSDGKVRATIECLARMDSEPRRRRRMVVTTLM